MCLPPGQATSLTGHNRAYHYIPRIKTRLAEGMRDV